MEIEELIMRLSRLRDGLNNIITTLKVNLFEEPEIVDDIEKLSKENDIPDWVLCGGSD